MEKIKGKKKKKFWLRWGWLWFTYHFEQSRHSNVPNINCSVGQHEIFEFSLVLISWACLMSWSFTFFHPLGSESILLSGRRLFWPEGSVHVSPGHSGASWELDVSQWSRDKTNDKTKRSPRNQGKLKRHVFDNTIEWRIGIMVEKSTR